MKLSLYIFYSNNFCSTHSITIKHRQFPTLKAHLNHKITSCTDTLKHLRHGDRVADTMTSVGAYSQNHNILTTSVYFIACTLKFTSPYPNWIFKFISSTDPFFISFQKQTSTFRHRASFFSSSNSMTVISHFLIAPLLCRFQLSYCLEY